MNKNDNKRMAINVTDMEQSSYWGHCSKKFDKLQKVREHEENIISL